MPPILAVFFALQALMHGTTLVKNVKGIDPQSSTSYGEASLLYLSAWATPNDMLFGKDHCDFRIYALATRNTVHRMVWDGKIEENLDWSWVREYRIKPGNRERHTATFINPVTRESVCREVTITCLTESGQYDDAGGAACEGPPPSTDHSEKSGLSIRAPKFVQIPVGMIDVPVYITVRVTNADEELWCPEIEVEWPDETLSVKSFDCKPYEETTTKDRETQVWEFSHKLQNGENMVKIRLRHGGMTIRTERVLIKVIG